jgi:hypothetical protein
VPALTFVPLPTVLVTPELRPPSTSTGCGSPHEIAMQHFISRRSSGRPTRAARCRRRRAGAMCARAEVENAPAIPVPSAECSSATSVISSTFLKTRPARPANGRPSRVGRSGGDCSRVGWSVGERPALPATSCPPPCPGHISVYRADLPARIEWSCTSCDDQGIISGWED